MMFDYDLSEYVTIPVGWDCKRLSDCTLDGNISYGIVQPGSHDIHGVPVIRINNIKNDQLDLSDVLKVSPEIEKKYERTRLNGGEVLLTLVGSTGQSFVAPKELKGWNVPRAIAVIRPNEEVGANWINICLQSRETKHFLDVRANTTVQKTLNLKDVRDIPILIPPSKVKDFIERIALSISDKIELNRQTNQTLEQIAQAIFKSLFVDFEPVKAKMAAKQAGANAEQIEQAAICAISGKTPEQLTQLDPQTLQQLKATAALFPYALVDSELGEIPEGWSIGCIGNIANVKAGYAFKGDSFINDGNPVVKIKNITGNGGVNLNGCQCIDYKLAKSAASFKLRDGDLLMAMTGATVAKTGIVVTEGMNIYLNQRVAKFESDKFGSKISWFLYCCFERDSIFDSVVGAAQGSAQPNISSSGIESTELVLPNDELIELFCNSVDSLFCQWIANISENSKLIELRDSLLPKLLSGEISLSTL